MRESRFSEEGQNSGALKDEAGVYLESKKGYSGIKNHMGKRIESYSCTGISRSMLELKC